MEHSREYVTIRYHGGKYKTYYCFRTEEVLESFDQLCTNRIHVTNMFYLIRDKINQVKTLVAVTKTIYVIFDRAKVTHKCLTM